MELFGIGPLEFILILVLALILLGPKGLVNGAYKTGEFIKRLVHSEGWRNVVQSTKEIRQAQDKIMQETGLQESLDELRQVRNPIHFPADLPERPPMAEKPQSTPISDTPSEQPEESKDEQDGAG